jgi:antitoxin component YwqK of YwqJK toxin-antitoxin module
MLKKLVIPIVLSSVLYTQNEGIVVTKYPSGAIKTEGNYIKGVRDGLWVWWYEGEVFEDYGEDGKPNTQDKGESNGVWDSTETVVLDLDSDTFFDPPQKMREGFYIEGNRENLWTYWYANGFRKEESNYTIGKLNGSLIRWHDNGNKSDEGTYTEGKQEGTWIKYYDSGTKMEQTKYFDGQQDGLWMQWFDDGKKNQNLSTQMAKETVSGHSGMKWK